ncbi:DUF3899 domain-containing protein [Staphylococcus gallinarum]|uniref:DUF3899 domain-containing protein n=1 Tax=Staphylococcus gallinarum TaxID=1293 RepID=UPI001E62F6CA|nr:DUF3899 domain-containing protein [Staphylococcus gallinarum]MCD8828641.1 DUF3899 domain-containing protein [Staphylococcus gallinarum]MDN6413666.1 DUF3899 domain-containing protein [Staphylococcus gallinarum]MEB6054576.1 DUF3899 domain-containing protein [Staphylococcus gallinarum]
MRQKQTLLIWLLLAPLISLILWLFGTHHFTHFVNILFYIATILTIILFVLIIVQEGILDPTSYGFRRLKYQLSSKKKRQALDEDEFFKPKQVKREQYIVETWVISGFIINLIYFILSIILAFTI